MSTKTCISLLTIFCLFSACGDGKIKTNANVNIKNEYPEGTKTIFLQACEAQSSGKHDFCECLLDKVQRRFTFEEFMNAQKEEQLEETQDFRLFAGKARVECMELLDR